MVAVRPPKWCAVALSEVQGRGLRLEASVYDVDARAARTRVISCKHGWTPLCGEGGLADAIVGSRFKRIWTDADHGTPIFQPSAVTELDPEPDGFLSAKTAANLDGLRVHAGQILLTCSGTIGKIGLVSRTLDEQVFSHDLLRLKCRNPCDTGYLYTFLKSLPGQLLLGGSQYGAVITHIEPEHLAALPVPNAPEEVKRRIHETVVKSYALRDESNDLMAQAQKLLLGALEMPERGRLARLLQVSGSNGSFLNNPRTFKGKPAAGGPPALPESPITFSVRLSELAGRLDGSYHVPIVRTIISHLREHAAEVATVGDRRISKAIILPGRFARVYVEEGFGRVMIGGKQLGELDPSNKKFLSASRHKKEIDSLAVHSGTILVTRSGTIGRVAFTPRHWDGWVPSDHILRVIPASADIGGYLYVWLSSEWAKPLIVRNSYGAVIDEISDAQLATVPVPLLRDAAVQAEINRLALEASSLRSEAYDLEQSALRMMDQEMR